MRKAPMSLWGQIGALLKWIVVTVVLIALVALVAGTLKARYRDAAYFYLHRREVQAEMEHQRLEEHLSAEEPVCISLRHVEPDYLGGGYAPYDIFAVYAHQPDVLNHRTTMNDSGCPRERFAPHPQNLGGGYYIASTFQAQ